MRPVQIDFVENGTWKLVWASTAFVLLAITLSMGGGIWQMHQKRVVLEQELASFQALELQELAERKATANPLGNVRAASEAAAARLLQRDWNPFYATIETAALAEARLVQLSFDSATGDATLEYELDKLEQAAHVSNALDTASRQSGRWRLERLESAEQNRSMSGAAKVKGYWRARVDQAAD